MIPDTEWVKCFPLSGHVDFTPLVRHIQADALIHAADIAENLQAGREKIASVLRRQADQLIEEK